MQDSRSRSVFAVIRAISVRALRVRQETPLSGSRLSTRCDSVVKVGVGGSCTVSACKRMECNYSYSPHSSGFMLCVMLSSFADGATELPSMAGSPAPDGEAS